MRPDPHDQAGLEVVPEPEAPQVVEYKESEFPQVVDGHANQNKSHPPASPYSQQYGSPVANGYAHPGYGQYDATTQPPHSQWAPSQVGTLGPSASQKGAKPKIMGITRKKFWLIFGPLIAVLVIGLAVGLGVGLGTSNKGSSSPAAATTTSSTTSSPTPSATSTVSSIICPANNGTIYKTPDDQAFLVLCNVDYNSGDGSGTHDSGNVVTSTVEDCAKTCAANGSCTGAGWGDYFGVKYCWMKSSLGKSQTAPNWYFLIKQ